MLRLRMALLGCAFVPHHRAFKLGDYAPPFLIRETGIELRVRVTSGGWLLEFSESITVIPGLECRQSGLEIG
ncbi:MAG: hypothetical protein O7H40_02675 [Gammaproteobacteria bacterium]|nr:hypothetical protein [Gammaproteobacteria bacterium]